MPLVPAKCPECGGNINIDSEKRAAICEFCKQSFVVEDAINHFNTTYNITNNNEIKADVVNVYENKTSEFVIKAGTLLEYNGVSMDVEIPAEVVSIGDVFKHSNIRSILVHDEVIEIDSNAFVGCRMLENVQLPKKMKGSLPSFYGCKALKNISISQGIEDIPDQGFSDCSSLKEICIPDGVKRIGCGTFANCLSLEEVALPESLESIGGESQYGTFEGCTSLGKIRLPEGVKFIGNRTFYGCSSLRKIEIPTSLTYIGDRAFAHCSGIQSILLPHRMNYIGKATFMGCSNLKEIRMPEYLNMEGYIREFEDQFKDCNSLEYIQIPTGVLFLGGEALTESPFQGCYNLKEVKLPKGIKRLGRGLFFDCKTLRKINIPDTVENLGVNCIGVNNPLDEIIVSNTIVATNWRIFKDTYVGEEYLRENYYKKKTCPICRNKISSFGKCKTNGCPNKSQNVFDSNGNYIGSIERFNHYMR